MFVICFIIIHKFSILFKSGELPGQSRALISFSENQFFIAFELVALRALSHKDRETLHCNDNNCAVVSMLLTMMSNIYDSKVKIYYLQH